ncbi:MAG: hypothetical protein AABZ30_02970 [Myxococcota bacterium]
MIASIAHGLRALVLVAALAAQGCATLNSVSMTRVPADRSHAIQSEAWTWGIFGIYFTNNFVDEAIDNLRGQCPAGRISGVYTKYSGRFFLLWTTRTVDVAAFCESAAAAKPQAAAP